MQARDSNSGLGEAYLGIEGDLEKEMGEVPGHLQGGTIDVITPDEILDWRRSMDRAGVFYCS